MSSTSCVWESRVLSTAAVVWSGTRFGSEAPMMFTWTAILSPVGVEAGSWDPAIWKRVVLLGRDNCGIVHGAHCYTEFYPICGQSGKLGSSYVERGKVGLLGHNGSSESETEDGKKLVSM